jgi:redox-sensitive bicupin YhaK (pirin superfamily)
MEAGAKWTLPKATHADTVRTLYFFRGSSLDVAGDAVAPRHAAVVRSDVDVSLTAGKDEVELLILQGRPIAEPVVQYGPFVMNTREEIQKAFADYQRTQFGGWPFADDGPVHGRESGRFAVHADGRTERA